MTTGAGVPTPGVTTEVGIEAGSRTEVDAIGGYVGERADEHGVDVPVNDTMTRLLGALGAGHGHR